MLYASTGGCAFGQVFADSSVVSVSALAPSHTGPSLLLASTREVSDEELSQMRAGFFTASGAQFDFGASVLTRINGELALQTNLLWTAGGPQVQQLPGLIGPITPQAAAAMNTGGGAAVTGMQISNPAGGSTQLFANVNAGQIQNILVNSASGQNITQNTNINLTIYNFQAWQLQLAQSALSSQLANQALSAAGLGAH